MQPTGIMAIVAAAAIWLPAGAQDMRSASRAANAPREPVRIKTSPVENHQPQMPESKDAGELPQRPTKPDNGWKWAFDGQRPALEYRMTEDTALRLRGAGGGVGVYVNWRF